MVGKLDKVAPIWSRPYPVREVGDDALVAADAEEIDGQLCMTSVQLRGRLAVTDLF